jgi:hypothetical protein
MVLGHVPCARRELFQLIIAIQPSFAKPLYTKDLLPSNPAKEVPGAASSASCCPTSSLAARGLNNSG